MSVININKANFQEEKCTKNFTELSNYEYNNNEKGKLCKYI